MYQTEEFAESELEESFFIGSGPGGQHRNKTETGCRLFHVPTGVQVRICSAKSQRQNRIMARKILAAKLKQMRTVKPERRTDDLVIRTYHEPDNRVKDESGAGSLPWSETVGRGRIGPLADMRFKYLAANPDCRRGVRTGRQ